MEWIDSLLVQPSAMQTVVVLSLICALGLALGKIKVMGVSLGVAFVFFVGIMAGNLGFSVDAAMLDYAQSFGLILFVYCLGLSVGPGWPSFWVRSWPCACALSLESLFPIWQAYFVVPLPILRLWVLHSKRYRKWDFLIVRRLWAALSPTHWGW